MADRLSIIIISYNMGRAAPRSIYSLTAAYQHKMRESDYEIIVVDNGSSEPLNEADITSIAGNIRYFYLENPPSSPAHAINFAVEKAAGQVLCVMIDGAHLVSPGILSYGLDLFSSLANPIVLAQRFFLGPGPQPETIMDGYDEIAEDTLLESIQWPEDGYRLYEIGYPCRIEPNGKRLKLFWFARLFESNCFFFRRSAFERINGCDERFDFPGGGLLLPDLYRQLADLDDVELVQLIGEASFHQLHGGISTSVSKDRQKVLWQDYCRQYEQIRGKAFEVTKKPLRFYGHIPNKLVRKYMLIG